MSTPGSIIDAALRAADNGLPVFPLAPLSKQPLIKGTNWREIATTDQNQILRWGQEYPRMNYGIACGDKADLFVIDIDTAEADGWWNSNGFPEGAVVRTPSGGRHIYYHVAGVEVQTNQSSLHPGVDVRGSGGYVVGPGSMLATGTYAGDIGSIPLASDELVAILPEKQVYTSTPRTGEKVEAATDAELRQINDQVKRLEALPRPWVEGAGWRSTFFRAACHFSRMVNSPDYAMTEGGAWEILRNAAPSDDEWGEPEQHEQWLSARKTTQGQYADVPVALRPRLLMPLDVLNELPAATSTGQVFTDLLFTSPEITTSGALWDRRKTILLEGYRAGLSDAQVATLAWNAKAGEPLQNDPNGQVTLWREVDAAKELAAKVSGAAYEPPSPDEQRSQKIMLLLDDEREFLGSEAGRWWGSRYLDWAKSEVKVFNAPYHRTAMWAILATVFSPSGYIPTTGRRTDCNLFQMRLGDTTTGKSEAIALEKAVLKACFPTDDPPFVGPKVSEIGLVRRLISRDGKPSILINDEASGLFKTLRDQAWAGGLAEFFAQLYDNDVPSIEMATHKDVSGIQATTWFNFDLTGVFSKVAEVLTTEEWESGLLPRFLITIGDKIDVDPSLFRLKLRESGEEHGYDVMPRQWAAEFHTATQALKSAGALPVELAMEEAAIELHDRMTGELNSMFDRHPLAAIIKPSAIRLGVNVLKAAGLAAMSEGALSISRRHMLIAIAQGEEWLQNTVRLASATSATAFTRQVDDIEKFIASNSKQEARVERVYRHSQRPKYETDRLIDQLIAEGRANRVPSTGGGEVIALRQEAIAA